MQFLERSTFSEASLPTTSVRNGKVGPSLAFVQVAPQRSPLSTKSAASVVSVQPSLISDDFHVNVDGAGDGKLSCIFSMSVVFMAALAARRSGRAAGRRHRSAILCQAGTDDGSPEAEAAEVAEAAGAEIPDMEQAIGDMAEALEDVEEEITHNGNLSTPYVNPWEHRLKEDIDPKTRPGDIRGPQFYPYEGKVYNQVPVIDGLEFPLDPTLYYPPLLPPEPGVKWGDGRAADGNWYMELDGQKVQYWQGLGKRKTAVAIVRLVKGDGQFIINGTEAVKYLLYNTFWWLKACEPLAALTMKNDYDILCKCHLGGLSGQAGAIRLGLARAMQEMDFELYPLLEASNFLVKDPRRAEPNHVGKMGARAGNPWHKR